MEMNYNYDEANNIMFVKYTGTISTIDDLNQMRTLTDQIYLNITKKIWIIADISEYKMKNASLVKEFSKTGKQNTEKYVMGEVMVCNNPIQKAFSLLFNAVRGVKSPIYKTVDEAVEYVLKRQETEGKSEPLK
ncbi:MAG: hypothetical protein R2883_06170 [Caldisericia bacterium]